MFFQRMSAQRGFFKRISSHLQRVFKRTSSLAFWCLEANDSTITVFTNLWAGSYEYAILFFLE